MKRCLIIVILLTIPLMIFAQGEKKPYIAEVSPDGVQRIDVKGGSYYFEPDHIVVKRGVPVELRVKRGTAIIPHNLVIEDIPEEGKKTEEALSREPKVILFTPAKTGRFKFHCNKKLLFFKSHRDRGMEGVIEVVE